MINYIILGGIYIVASLVQGLTAFGFAVISVPLVAAMTDPTTAIAYNVVIATAVSMQKAYLMRDRIEVRWTLLFLVAALPFIPLGVLFISNVPRDLALAVMGVYVIVAAALRLLSGKRPAERSPGRAMRTKAAYWVTAVLTGLLAGAFSAPGPATVPYFLSRQEDTLTGQANLTFFFSTLFVPILGLHMLLGDLRPADMLPGFIYIPVAMIATHFATRWAKRMNTNILRTIVTVAMIVMGAYLLISPLLRR